MDENMNYNANEEFVDAPAAQDDDLLDFEQMTEGVDMGEHTGPSLNGSKEFLRQFADSFPEEFVIDLPVNAVVTNAIAKAKAESQIKLEAQVRKENNRKKELLARYIELQKQQ